MPQMLEFFVVAAIALIVTAYGPNDLVNTTRICGDRDYISAGDYTLVNNIWGPGLQDGTKAVGFQCAVSNFIFSLNIQISSILRPLTDGILLSSPLRLRLTTNGSVLNV